MAPPRDGGGDTSSEQHRPVSRLTQSLRKCLLLCWLLVIANIWFASDNNDDDEFLEHTFGEPEREVRMMHQPINNENGFAMDGQGILDSNQMVNSGEILADDAAPVKSDLPDALQPITSKTCCVPAAYKETHHPKDVDCFGTCYTERACNDVNFPFTNAEEKAQFPTAEWTKETRNKLKEECKAPVKMAPPVEWCQNPHTDENKASAAHLVKDIPPAGCVHITQGGGSGAFQHVIIFPKAKLAFCGIPKVGITQWEQFLRFTFGAKDYPSMPHYRLDRNFFQFDSLDPAAQRRIWEDEEWTWATFVRNPAERILSAYLDKIKSGQMRHIKDVKKISFESFIDILASPVNYTRCEGSNSGLSGLSWCSDPHWRPQVYSCGLSERIDRFQYIGDLEHAAGHTKELLSHVGLWESHGRQFINGGIKAGRSPWGCNMASHPFNHTINVGFQQKDEDNNSSLAGTRYDHAKGAKEKMEQYFTPELLKKVEELYADDYKLWSKVNANGDKISKGKDLMKQLSDKCYNPPSTLDRQNDADKSTEVESSPNTPNKTESHLAMSENENEPNQSVRLAEALQPKTFSECCIPAIYNGTKTPKDVLCFGTCFNERACNDPLYPFNSLEEKAQFPLAQLSFDDKKKLREECQNPQKLVPSVEWCQAPSKVVEESTAAHLVDGIPPAGCSTITNGGGSGPFQHVLLFPSAKLAFCGVPKVGISQWEQFLRFTFGAKDYPSLPHYKLDRELLQFGKLDPAAQRRIWEDEEWTWAAFIRNPAERLLSAYLDKAEKKDTMREEIFNGTLTFDRFIDNLDRPLDSNNCKQNKFGVKGISWCSDPHWRPQVYSCGLSERIDRFQYIGDLEHAADHTKELLSHVGLWKSHGKQFINGGVKAGLSKFCTVASHPHNHTTHVGFQQKDEDTNSSAAKLEYGHVSGSKEKMNSFYTPGSDLLERVQDLYSDDYKLWKLVNANGNKLSRGKDLMKQLSDKC